jgi:hypothetical protein
MFGRKGMRIVEDFVDVLVQRRKKDRENPRAIHLRPSQITHSGISLKPETKPS